MKEIPNAVINAVPYILHSGISGQFTYNMDDNNKHIKYKNGSCDIKGIY